MKQKPSRQNHHNFKGWAMLLAQRQTPRVRPPYVQAIDITDACMGLWLFSKLCKRDQKGSEGGKEGEFLGVDA